jgi:hypothetical protein
MMIHNSETPDTQCHFSMGPEPNVTRGGIVYKMHRLICSFTYNMPITTVETWQARHLCGNARCIRVEPLVPGTVAENAADKAEHGTHQRGERHGLSKLTDQDVRTIRRRLANGHVQTRIADDFGVAHSTVSLIKRGITWSHVRDTD